MILDNIIAKRKEQLLKEKQAVPLAEMVKKASGIITPKKGIKSALSKDGISFISEDKKASPSKGIICEDFHPVRIAKEYEKAGASAISVLTEEYYFKGSSNYLSQIRDEVEVPLLRKDFIFDEYQIYEARVIGADAILLIAGILTTSEIIEFRKIAGSLGLDCIVEVHNEEELEKALKADCDIIGINNRDLKTFNVSLETTKKLASKIPQGKIIVSESGIVTRDDIVFVKNARANAVLIGETLMRSENIKSTLDELRGKSEG